MNKKDKIFKIIITYNDSELVDLLYPFIVHVQPKLGKGKLLKLFRKSMRNIPRTVNANTMAVDVNTMIKRYVKNKDNAQQVYNIIQRVLDELGSEDFL